MSVVYAPGIPPLAGDEALIDQRSAADPLRGTGWLLVAWSEPCDDARWMWLVGTWPDGSAGRVMVWLERLIVRRTG